MNRITATALFLLMVLGLNGTTGKFHVCICVCWMLGICIFFKKEIEKKKKTGAEKADSCRQTQSVFCIVEDKKISGKLIHNLFERVFTSNLSLMSHSTIM